WRCQQRSRIIALIYSEIRMDVLGGGFGGENDHRCSGFCGFSDTGASIRETAALMDTHETDFAAHPAIGICHGGCTAFVAGSHKLHPCGTEGICDLEIAASDHTENVPNAKLCQVCSDLLCNGYHADAPQFCGGFN